jgi:Putative phage serine protease XkdF
MPWVAADADRHKKGLSAKQKRQWAHVANSALERCQAESGTDCEGRAVRQANSAVDKSFDTEHLALVVEAAIAKADDTQRRLFGWASIAVRKDGTPLLDLQGDVIEISDLAEAWYAYVQESGELNFLHKEHCAATLIEAIVFTPDKLEALGLPPDALPLGAWVGFQVDDLADYQVIKERGYFMFSIEGEALREAF